MAARVGPQAPGELELVRAFVNTLDIEDGQEHLRSAADLDAWAGARGLAPPGAADPDLARLVELREALRAVLLAHHDGAADDEGATAVISRGMRWGAVIPVVSAQGLSWASADAGVAGLVGRLMRAVAEAAAVGTWSRLKACSSDDCRWAFYDHSRSRTGKWCSMQACGNRAKQRRFHQSGG